MDTVVDIFGVIIFLWCLLYIGMKLDKAAKNLDRAERWIYEERKRKK